MGTVVDGLRQTYWAKDRSENLIRKAWDHSTLVFGLYEVNPDKTRRLLGFARVISDLSIVAYLADVFLSEEFRGLGLGKWMVESIMGHPELQNVRWLLQTRDMHRLYRKLGFTDMDPGVMVRARTEILPTLSSDDSALG